MYDITNNASFTKLSDWFTASNQTLTEQTNFTESSDKFMIGKDGPFLALVGNKCKILYHTNLGAPICLWSQTKT